MKSLTYVSVCRRLVGVLCSVMISGRQKRDFRNLQVCQLGSEEERCKPWEKVDHSGARFDLCTVYTSSNDYISTLITDTRLRGSIV